MNASIKSKFLLLFRVIRIVNAQIVIHLTCSIRIMNINLFWSLHRLILSNDLPFSLSFVHSHPSTILEFQFVENFIKLITTKTTTEIFRNANCIRSLICLLACFLFGSVNDWRILAGRIVLAEQLIQLPM